METNPTSEMLKVFLSVMIFLFLGTIAIIRYFLIKRDSAITETTDKLLESNTLLKEAIMQLKELVNSLQLQYQIRQPIVDERLKKHGEEITELNNELGELQRTVTQLATEHSLLSCKSPVKVNHKKKPIKKES